MFIRNFKAMYRQSLLGLVWAFVPPIMSTLVWVFLNGQRIINIADPGVPYPAFVLISTLLWSVFAQSLLMPNSVMQSGKSIMVKINFPKVSLLISGILQIGFDFMVKSLLIVGVFIIFKVVPSPTIFLAPLGILMLAGTGIAMGLILLPIGMLYTDVQRLLGAILPFWMLLTPVIYPSPRAGIGTLLNKYNPVAPILTTTRDWMFLGHGDYVFSFLILSVVVAVLIVIGLVVFKLTMPIIIERSGG
jgi:lipopolysaccharide transport system permease protein